MTYNQKQARAAARAVPALSKVGAGISFVGAAFCFFASIGGWLTGDILVKHSLIAGALGLLFLGMGAYQIAMGRWAGRLVKSWASTHQAPRE